MCDGEHSYVDLLLSIVKYIVGDSIDVLIEVARNISCEYDTGWFGECECGWSKINDNEF